MRTFYIFKIKEEYSKLTKNIPDNLYHAFLKMKLSAPYNLEHIMHEYHSIIMDLDREQLNNHFYQTLKASDGYMLYRYTHMYNDYYSGEISKLILYRSFFILKSNQLNSLFFSVLEQIPHLFVIDFENKDYFWLADTHHLRLVNERHFSYN